MKKHWHSRAIDGTLPEYAAGLHSQGRDFVWLDSADTQHPYGTRSILAAGRTRRIPPSELTMPPGATVSGGASFVPGNFIAINYDSTQALVLDPELVIVEEGGQLWGYGDELPPLTTPPTTSFDTEPLRADVDRKGYERDVEKCKTLLGDIQQLCLTTTFRTRTAADPFALYLRMRQQNPAPMASFWLIDGLAFLSSSPERFLSVGAEKRVVVSPIKGTRGRGLDAQEDEFLKRDLETSKKDRLENQLVIEVMRRDLHSVCLPDSVRVTEECVVHTFSAAHQMISTVEGYLTDNMDPLQAVLDVMPPGSMTGAPKAEAVEILNTIERNPRGWYSGIAGHIDGDGEADFSVLIRTAVIENGEVSYGAGGAITPLSNAQDEAAEVAVKTRPLKDLLCL